LVLRGQKT